MPKPLLFIIFLFPAIFFFIPVANAQVSGKDTFFLSRKKGLLGKLGKSISTDGIPRYPEKSVNPFKRFNGKIIRSIQITPKGLEQNESGDTSHTIISKIANTFHRTSSEHVIRNNLFFREGEKLSPLLLVDNQRFLREQTYLRDAWIIVQNTRGTGDSVDVMIITKDVFSIGGSLNISSSERAKFEIRDENL
ncbi:MAG TPA: hypothetical protein VK498_03585, partial [Ferruginibacter sp.]|nr:hypothetical protein [Ferruginibacter sp.]